MKEIALRRVFAAALVLFSVSSIRADEEDLSTRREMLQWHQVAGLATWGLWLATNLKGEQAIHSLRRTGEPVANAVLLANPQNNWPLYYAILNQSEWEAKRGGDTHRTLAGLTAAAYATTAALALFSPSRPAESDSFDSITAHKWLAVLHFAALASLPVIGSRIERRGPAAAHEMQRVGWAGFGALTVAVGVFYF